MRSYPADLIVLDQFKIFLKLLFPIQSAVDESDQLIPCDALIFDHFYRADQ
jgi:hypothetical protein